MDLEIILPLIGVIGLYGLSFLEYKGLYWPLKIKYEEHSKRRLFQKTNAFLMAITASIVFISTLVNPGFINQKGYYITLGLYIFTVTMLYLNKSYFVKQKGIYQ